jgi:nucleoid-associated protein YgaU
LRRTGQKQVSDLRSLTAERESLQSQLVDARKVATVLPGLADEKVALQERLETVGTQMVQLQREHEELQKTNVDLSAQLAASRQTAEKAQGELAAVQTRNAEAEKAADAHNTSVAELTQANTRLETEREDMRRLVESYRGDIARLTQMARAAEQQKTDAERSGQQNVDAVTAQMAQLRRELDAARANQARLTEAYATQERDRATAIAQLRTENGALAARLNQAQGTLDQIAAAARLGTPAATIASGGTPTVRPAPTASSEVRYHTVAEGDSLSRISMRYYGTSTRWQEIFQANRDVLQGSSSLRVGMQLRIP